MWKGDITKHGQAQRPRAGLMAAAERKVRPGHPLKLIVGLCLSLRLRKQSVVVTSPCYFERSKYCLQQQGCMGNYRSVVLRLHEVG